MQSDICRDMLASISQSTEREQLILNCIANQICHAHSGKGGGEEGMKAEEQLPCEDNNIMEKLCRATDEEA